MASNGGEPHITGTAVRELYIIMVHRSREIYAQDGSMDISAKYSCAHSHVWATGHSNLTNFKFTLAIGVKGGVWERDSRRYGWRKETHGQLQTLAVQRQHWTKGLS